MNSQKLAVVIPAYMAEKTLEKAIRSARASGADEVIVIDDGSTDKTREVAVRSGATYMWQENAGAVVARKNGATLTDAEYLVFLDADDQLMPSGVAASIAHLEAHPGDVVAAGRVIGVGAGGRQRSFPIRYSPVNTQTLLQNGYGPWPPCAAVIRAAGYRESLAVKPAPLKTPFAEDYEMLIRLSLVGSIFVSDEPTCYYAMAGGKSERSARLAIRYKEEIRAYYSHALGIHIAPLTKTESLMAADIRRARAEIASRRYLPASLTFMRWFMRDPALGIRKLVSKPWTRN